MGAIYGCSGVGLCQRRSEVDPLGARADRIAHGAVNADGVGLADGNRAGVGDWVTTRANDRTLATTGSGFVKNGDLWHVTAQHRDGSLTVQRLGDRPGRVRLPAAYVTADRELAYATTAHPAKVAPSTPPTRSLPSR